MKLKKTLAILGALCLTAGPAFPELTRIGGAGAVKGSVNAVAPDSQVGRVIESGKPLYLNDHVTTKGDSHLQVMLLDESVFTLGPDSDMVLDEFVYDPTTSAGKVTAKLTKGVFRFVTGKVARKDPSAMKIRVPTGTIGIRGTRLLVMIESVVTKVMLEGAGLNNTANETPGRVEVFGEKGPSQMLTREGFGTDLAAGQAATTPSDHSADLIRINALLNPKPQSNSTPPNAVAGGKKTDAVGAVASVIQALGSLAGTQSANQQSTQNSQTTNQANQNIANQGVPNGPATWQSLSAAILGGILTGTGLYSNSANPVVMPCSGAGCTGAQTMYLTLLVNFGAQTLGDPSSSCIHFQTTGGDTSEMISATPFGTSGTATITLNSNNLNSASGPLNNNGATLYQGTTITLTNSANTLAKVAAVNVVFSGSTSLSQAATVSGTFNASR